MSSGATNPQELESLVTKFFVDDQEFMTKTQGIMDRTDAVVAKFGTMAQALTMAISELNAATAVAANAMSGSVAALTQASTAVAAAATGANVTAVNAFSQSLGGLSQSVTGLQGVSGSLQGLLTALGNLGSAANNVNATALSILDLRESIAGWNIARLTAVSQGIDTFAASVRSFRNAGTNIGELATSIGSLRESLSGWNTGRLGTLSQALDGFGTAMGTVGGAAAGVGQLAPAITLLRDSLKGWNTAQLTTLGTAVGNLGAGFATLGNTSGSISQLSASVANLGSANLTNFGANAQTIGTGLSNMIGALTNAGTTAGNVSQLATAMGNLKTSLTGVNVRRLSTLTTSIGGFATSLASLGNTAVNVGQLQQNLDALVTSLNTSASNFSKPAVQMARSLARLTAAVHDMSLVNAGAMLQNARAVTTAMNLIGTINTSNIQNAVSLLNQARRAMQGMAGGGGLPPGGGGGGAAGGGGWFGMNKALKETPQAAGNAGFALRAAAYDSMVLQRNAEGAGGALISLRYGLLGLGALGLFQFAQMDDALIRLSARTRDFTMQFHDEMRMGLLVQTGKSINSITEQGKALERLRVAGLSATASVRALAAADDFATASGMKMGEATKGLTDLMHAMDLTGNTAAEFRDNMQHLSDILIGTSTLTGATEKQMMEAFTSRFQTSSRLAKLTIDESVAVLGGFARAGDTYRGAKGGNIAARGILQLTQGLKEGGRWMEIFGEKAYDAEGNVRPLFEVLTMLQEKMGKVGTEKFIANLDLTGLGGPEKTFAIEPLLRTLGTAKNLREEMKNMRGAATQMADTIRMSLMSQMYNLGNSLGNASAVIGERLAPALYAITQPLTDMMNAFAELNPAIQNFVVYGGLAYIAWRQIPWIFSSLTSVITTLVTAPFRLLYNTIVGTWTVLKTLTGWIGTAFGAVGKAIYYTVGVPLNWAMERFIDFTVVAKRAMEFLFVELAKWTGAASSVFLTVVQGALVGAISLVMGLLSAVLLLPPALAAITFALAAVGGLVATVGLTIYQLGEHAVKGLANAWESVKNNSREALQWMGDKVGEVTVAVNSMGDALRRGGMAFLETAGAVIRTWSGLIWNFKENSKVILDFIEKNGAQAVEDILRASMKSLEALKDNLVLFVKAVGTSIRLVFEALWQNIKNIGNTIRNWVRGSWDEITADINNVFNTFTANFLHNWGTMTDAMGSMLKNNLMSHIIQGLISLDKIVPGIGKTLFVGAAMHGLIGGDSDEKAMEKARKNMKNIFTGLEPMKTNTDVLGESLVDTFGRNQKIWNQAGTDMAVAFSDAFSKMNPIIKAFRDLADTPIWRELLFALKFDLPTWKEAGDFMKKSLNLGPTGDETSGMASGKGGPGFTFKQGSMERFVYDGAVNEKIQYQMLHHIANIDKNAQLIAAQHGRDTPEPRTTLNISRPNQIEPVLAP